MSVNVHGSKNVEVKVVFLMNVYNDLGFTLVEVHCTGYCTHNTIQLIDITKHLNKEVRKTGGIESM